MWDSDQALVTVKPSESRTNRKFPSRVCFAWIREYIRTSGLGVRTHLWIGGAYVPLDCGVCTSGLGGAYAPLDWGCVRTSGLGGALYLWIGGKYIPLD